MSAPAVPWAHALRQLRTARSQAIDGLIGNPQTFARLLTPAIDALEVFGPMLDQLQRDVARHGEAVVTTRAFALTKLAELETRIRHALAQLQLPVE